MGLLAWLDSAVLGGILFNFLTFKDMIKVENAATNLNERNSILDVYKYSVYAISVDNVLLYRHQSWFVSRNVKVRLTSITFMLNSFPLERLLFNFETDGFRLTGQLDESCLHRNFEQLIAIIKLDRSVNARQIGPGHNYTGRTFTVRIMPKMMRFPDRVDCRLLPNLSPPLHRDNTSVRTDGDEMSFSYEVRLPRDTKLQELIPFLGVGNDNPIKAVSLNSISVSYLTVLFSVLLRSK
jgi:hypothetical protein